MKTHRYPQQAQQFLASWDLSFDDLISYFDTFGANECLLLTGSISHDLANEESDIDLMYIGERPLTTDYLMVNSAESTAWTMRKKMKRDVNVDCHTLAFADGVISRLKNMIDIIDNPDEISSIHSFNYNELQFLSRIYDGIPLINNGLIDQIRCSARLDRYPDYLMLKYISEHMILREDMLAQAALGDWKSGYGIMQLAAANLVGCVLASYNEVCVNPKWQVKQLIKYEDLIGADIVQKCIKYKFLFDVENGERNIKEFVDFSNRVIGSVCQRFPQLAEVMVTIKMKIKWTTELHEAVSNAGKTLMAEH